MKEKLEYKNDRERTSFIIKHDNKNIADDLPNKIIYYLDDNEYFENGEIKINENYAKEKLEKEKQTKLQKVYLASTKKYSEQNQTITINLPVTLTDGKTEINVDSFKLLTVTSAGLILPVLTGMVILATQSDIPDMLATADGLFVKGLNTATNNVKLIAQIFAKFGESQAKITAYQRTLEVQINACTTIEDLSKIQIDFDQF